MLQHKQIQLPQLPQDEYYEDLIAAILCAGGFYVEKRIDLREPTNVLELDIVTSKYYNDHVDKKLAEVKSKDWKFGDVFKVRGWMDYLNMTDASFICLNTTKQDFTQMQQVAANLHISLLDLQIANNNIEDQDLLADYKISVTNTKLFTCAVGALRFAFVLERTMLNKYLIPMVKDPNGLSACKSIRDFIYTVCEHSFFQNNPNARLREVFQAFIDHKKITARLDTEKRTGVYESADNADLSNESFSYLFYESPAEKSPLHLALYAELVCRQTMLQLCVEEIYRDSSLNGFMRTLERMVLPENIKNGMQDLSTKHQYFYLYPHFWQTFIFLFGGFVLTDKIDEEYKMLSEITGVPVDKIDEALSAFDILFPISGSWLFDKKNSNIKILQFMPLQIAGVGANFRRVVYRTDDKDVTFESLGQQLKGNYTLNDLIKYNNILIEYLWMDKNIAVQP